MADNRTYFRVADDIDENPKMLELSDAAFRLDLHGISYCARRKTDGKVPKAMVPRLKANYSKPLAELVRAGRWIQHSDHYEIHDYLEHQRSKASIESITNARREAGKRGGRPKARSEANEKQKETQRAEAEAEGLKKYSPPPLVDGREENGGGADASLSKIKSKVIKALTLRSYTDDEIAPGLEMLEMRLNAGEGERINSPVAYVRSFAEKARAAAKRAEPNRQEIDGELHEYVEGEGWVPVEEVEAS